jgi:ABC-type glutathione transport system ATPase component
VTPLLEARGLARELQVGSALAARFRGRPAPAIVAIDGVDLVVERGPRSASWGVGMRQVDPRQGLDRARPLAGGSIEFDGSPLGDRRDRATMRRIQMIFQDPGSSLNPSRTVEQTLTEQLRGHRIVPADRVRSRAGELMELVELPQSLLAAHPRRLSGGQRQRVGIARALALDPEILIADEAVAALDVSVQASVLNLLAKLRRDLGLTLLFISHDLAVVRHISERVIVMYLGRVVEIVLPRICSPSRHPYTAALMAAARGWARRNDPASRLSRVSHRACS